MHVGVHAWMCVSMHACVRACMEVCLCICMRAYMCVCKHACMYIRTHVRCALCSCAFNICSAIRNVLVRATMYMLSPLFCIDLLFRLYVSGFGRVCLDSGAGRLCFGGARFG